MIEVSKCRIHQLGFRDNRTILSCSVNRFRGCANPFQTCEKDRREREEEARQEEHRKLLAERNQRALDRALAPAFVKVGWEMRTSQKLQSIPKKDLQGFCPWHLHVALPSHFGWLTECHYWRGGNLVTLFLELTVILKTI